MRILFLYYFLFPQLSQTQSIETGLAAQFFKNQPVLWEKTYVGLWDDVIPVQLELVSDGSVCKGYFYFGDIKNKYVLSGTLKNNELKLEEQDLQANVTGRLVLNLSDKLMVGTWYNSKKSFHARLNLMEGATPTVSNYWVRSYGSKNTPDESILLQHKEFSDQITTRFYYKLLNKTLHGTSEIKDEENFSQEAVLEDYLHHRAGTLSSWKSNEKKIDITYKLGTIEYNKSLDLLLQIPIVQETFADHWMAVDINYPKIDKPDIISWFRHLVDTFIVDIQAKKISKLEEDDQADPIRMAWRMSIWPQFDFLNEQFISGKMHIKNSWDESTSSVPFTFDLKEGHILALDELITDPIKFEVLKSKWVKQELVKLSSGADLDYKSLQPNDFTLMTLKKEGFVFATAFDMIYGIREIILPYTELKDILSPKYFPL